MTAAKNSLYMAIDEQCKVIDATQKRVDDAKRELNDAETALQKEQAILNSLKMNVKCITGVVGHGGGGGNDHDGGDDGGDGIGENGGDGGGGRGLGSDTAVVPVVSASGWLKQVREAVVAAVENPCHKRCAGRAWHQQRKLNVHPDIWNGDVEGPVLLGVIEAEPQDTQDARALRASSTPPSHLSGSEKETWLRNNGGISRISRKVKYFRIVSNRTMYVVSPRLTPVASQVFEGLCNMFMQSGIVGILQLKLIEIPAQGMGVWLAVALLLARHMARQDHRSEPETLVIREVIENLQLLPAASDEFVAAMNRLRYYETPNMSWDFACASGTGMYGSAYEACMELSAFLQVHIPMMVLGRHEDHQGFSISYSICGDPTLPSCFGEKNGFVLTYEGGPALTHVDLLVGRGP